MTDDASKYPLLIQSGHSNASEFIGGQEWEGCTSHQMAVAHFP